MTHGSRRSDVGLCRSLKFIESRACGDFQGVTCVCALTFERTRWSIGLQRRASVRSCRIGACWRMPDAVRIALRRRNRQRVRWQRCGERIRLLVDGA
eukprot:scaffold201478_cov31-Tisochrysis_lutea.AAC.2